MKHRDAALPFAYLTVAVLLAVVVLPTSLRPPQQRPPSSGALAPNAPPDDQQETLISSLNRAGSRTAGAILPGETVGPDGTGVAIVSQVPEPRAARGPCFGNPPRQTESAYSPPCRPAFVGDNGGSTSKNVSASLVRVGYWHLLGMPPGSERGPIEDVPPPNESAEHRTARVIQAYFNTRYELYGRKLQLVATSSDAGGAEGQRATAGNSEQVDRVFAAVHLFDPYCYELARRQLMCFNGNPSQPKEYASREPFFWSYQMNTGQVDQIAAEYVCKKLVGRTADHAGGVEKGAPRRIGVITESSSDNGFRPSSNIVRELRAQCGYEAAANVDFLNDAEAYSSTIAKMRAAGVTTIILEASLAPTLGVMATSDSSGYFPEWVMFNSYGIDFNGVARLLPPTQSAHLFGMSGWELPRPFVQRDCYRAYKSVDPDGAPNANFCNLLWISIEHLANGIQEAGPNLNAQTFRDGMFRMPLRFARESWAIAGGYGPSDYSFVDTFMEMWWDQNAIDPDGGARGAYRFTNGGKRFGVGDMTSELRVFQEGVTGG